MYFDSIQRPFPSHGSRLQSTQELCCVLRRSSRICWLSHTALLQKPPHLQAHPKRNPSNYIPWFIPPREWGCPSRLLNPQLLTISRCHRKTQNTSLSHKSTIFSSYSTSELLWGPYSSFQLFLRVSVTSPALLPLHKPSYEPGAAFYPPAAMFQADSCHLGSFPPITCWCCPGLISLSNLRSKTDPQQEGQSAWAGLALSSIIPNCWEPLEGSGRRLYLNTPSQLAKQALGSCPCCSVGNFSGSSHFSP